MPPAAQLKSLLAKGPLVSDNLHDAATLCESWYMAEPSLATFTLHALVGDLVCRDWDDKQGIATSVYQPFKDRVVPVLSHVVDILVATPAAEPIAELDALAVAYRDSLRATP